MLSLFFFPLARLLGIDGVSGGFPRDLGRTRPLAGGRLAGETLPQAVARILVARGKLGVPGQHPGRPA